MSRPPKNNCDYFSHDADMRNHKKVKALRSTFGVSGYAIWSMILEYLTGSDGNVFPYTDLEFELMSGDFGVPVTEIRSVVDYCIRLEMLFNKNGFINSESLDERLIAVYQKRGRAKELSKKQLRMNGKFVSSNSESNGVSVTEIPESKVKESKVKESKVKESTKVLSTSVDDVPKNEFEKSILEIIREIKSEYLEAEIRPYKITNKRTKLITNRKKEFDKLWPGRNFEKACQFAFRYKAKEWFGTETFRFFEPETLLSEKFTSYVEKAEQDKGEPYVPKPKGEDKPVYRIPQ